MTQRTFPFSHLLLASGALFVSGGLVQQHYFPALDAANGLTTGCGIGLMLLALITAKKARRNAAR